MKTSVDSTFYEGQITVVGNEPFTKLALIIDDTTIYTLECDKATKDSLWKNQGKYYRIFANEKIVTKTGTKLKIDKSELIRN